MVLVVSVGVEAKKEGQQCEVEKKKKKRAAPSQLPACFRFSLTPVFDPRPRPAPPLLSPSFPPARGTPPTLLLTHTSRVEKRGKDLAPCINDHLVRNNGMRSSCVTSRPGAALALSATGSARLAAPSIPSRALDLRVGRVAAPLPGGAAGPAGRSTRALAPPAGRRALHVAAVFERFTERAIKGVMLAQQEAKALGSSEVREMKRRARHIPAPSSRALCAENKRGRQGLFFAGRLAR